MPVHQSPPLPIALSKLSVISTCFCNYIIVVLVVNIWSTCIRVTLAAVINKIPLELSECIQPGSLKGQGWTCHLEPHSEVVRITPAHNPVLRGKQAYRVEQKELPSHRAAHPCLCSHLDVFQNVKFLNKKKRKDFAFKVSDP